jgi:hypothetical protein
MRKRLADRLEAARLQAFVGREEHRHLFEDALREPEPSFVVLYVYGPGGVGKTTLLHEYAALAREAGVPTCWIDGLSTEPTEEGFTAALHRALDLATDRDPIAGLMDRGARQIVFIDACERLAPLDGWLREQFLPELPDETLLVLAGRRPLPPAWRSSGGWESLVRTIALRNFSPVESKRFLDRTSLPAPTHDAVLAFTHGHPLALSLVANLYEQRPFDRFRPSEAPDVIRTLLDHFIQEVPGPAHRTALEACALVNFTTEPLLATMLDTSDVTSLFDWLHGLSFIEASANGLYPLDLVREALAANLRWRNPTWHKELHRRARGYYFERLSSSHGLEQQQVLIDYVYLHRDNPVFRPFLRWEEMATGKADAPRESDWPVLESALRTHEGPSSIVHARYWHVRQPEGFMVFRDRDGMPVGFMVQLVWDHRTDPAGCPDPAVASAAAYLRKKAPLREGEHAVYFRLWLGAEAYQSVSAVQSLIFLHISRYYLTTPNLAFSFFPCADAAFWVPFAAYIDLMPIPEADFETDGRRFAVFGHDWRVRPPMPWLNLLAEREVSEDPSSVGGGVEVTVMVLNAEDFADAVHEALKAYTRPDTLMRSPLLHARMVIEEARGESADTADRIAALVRLLEQAAGLLDGSERTQPLYNVIYRTYFRPARSQEQAAETLQLPFSTYRRYLKKAVETMTEWLWQREVHGGT